MDKTEIRKHFPVTQKYIYLDHSGVGPITTDAEQAAVKFLADAAENAFFSYDNWMEQIEDVRRNCSVLIGSSPDEIAFVRNTSHGISLVASGIEWKSGDSVVVYEKEFPSNIYPWLNLEKKGVELRVLRPESSEINIGDIEKTVDSTTRLISISSVQFTTGYRADLEAIGKFCRENDIYFFVDAIQSLGILPMDVNKYGIDFLAADGHKWMLSPEGTGIFYCSKRVTDLVNPSLIGWKSIVDEFEYEKINFTLKPSALKFEEGSLSVLSIAALGGSINLLMETGIENIMHEVQRLGDVIIQNVGERGFNLISPEDKNKRGGLITFSGEFDSKLIIEKLKERKIRVNARGGGIRISPHFYNTDEEINAAFEEIDKLLS